MRRTGIVLACFVFAGLSQAAPIVELDALDRRGEVVKLDWVFELTGNDPAIIDMLVDGVGGCAFVYFLDRQSQTSPSAIVWLDHKGEVQYSKEFERFPGIRLIAVSDRALVMDDPEPFVPTLLVIDRKGAEQRLSGVTIVEGAFSHDQEYKDRDGFIGVTVDENDKRTAVVRYRY